MSSALSWCAGPAALAGIVPALLFETAPRPAPAPAHATVVAPQPPASAPPAISARVDMPPAAVWLALARRALMHERYEEALRCFDGAVAHEPQLALAHLGRAVCLSQMGCDEDAREATEVVLDAARGQEEILYHLARMCAAEGQTTIGVALLRDAVRAVPELEERAANDRLFADHPAYLMAIGRL